MYFLFKKLLTEFCVSVCTLAWLPKETFNNSPLKIFIEEENLCYLCYTKDERKLTDYYCLLCKVRVCQECFNDHRRPVYQDRKPISVYEPVHAEEPEPVSVEEPAHVDEPVSVEEPAHVDEPVSVEEPAHVDEPVSVEEPAHVDEPVSVEEPAHVDESVSIEEPAHVDESVSEEEPAPVELRNMKDYGEMSTQNNTAVEEPLSPELTGNSSTCVLLRMPQKVSSISSRLIRQANICSICSTPKKKLKTIYRCGRCKVGVCLKCFDYHRNQVNIKQNIEQEHHQLKLANRKQNKEKEHHLAGIKSVEVCIEKLPERLYLMNHEEEPACAETENDSGVCKLSRMRRTLSKTSSTEIWRRNLCSVCIAQKKRTRTVYRCASCQVAVCLKCFDCHRKKLIRQKQGLHQHQVCDEKLPETQDSVNRGEGKTAFSASSNQSGKCAQGKLPWSEMTAKPYSRRRETHCSVCSTSKQMKRTIFYCTRCEIGVCKNCFDKHKNRSLNKRKTLITQRLCVLGKLPKLPSSRSCKLIQREKPCVICSTRNKKKRTVYYCMPCNVGVCKECFNGHCEKTSTLRKRYKVGLKYR